MKNPITPILFKGFCTVLLFSSINSFSQITFSDNTALLTNTTLTSGVSIGVADMNGDGRDDIIRLDNASNLEIEYQPMFGAWTSLVFGNTGPSNEWSMCVADADNNGFNDIILGGANNGLKFLTANGTGTNYSSSNLSAPNIFLQGSNFADMNNDGEIDFFGCHDNGISSAYSGDGAGNFTYDLGLINAASTVPSDNSGNYGSVWTDYDNDGDLDMYLSKCRLGVTDPFDGRRINLLFQNDGSNNFTDVAAAAGMIPYGQSWATDFADVDNDGDLDAFVINHDIPNMFYINNGDGTFTDVTATTGIVADLAAVPSGIQCKFEDFDNDGYVDLLLTGIGSHQLFWNNGDWTFTTAATNLFATSGNGIHSAAIGDLNHDGFVDVMTAYATSYNSPTSNPDILFLNNGNENNFFNVQLTGTNSNVNAIGAKVLLYGAWGMQMREVRAGEGYGVFNSFTMHFGIGTNPTIDSVVVKWPSGTVDKFCNPSINTFFGITEGTSTSYTADFTESSSNLIASFVDASSIAPTNWSWDFGDGGSSNLQNPTYSYATAGTYTVCLEAGDGCNSDVSCQSVIITCPIATADFSFSSNGVNAYTFTNTTTPITGGLSYSWDFGDGNSSTLESPAYTYSIAGSYNVCFTITDSCGSNTSCQQVDPAVTGIPEEQLTEIFTLYPNPTKGNVFIQRSNSSESAVLFIRNILGKTILEKSMIKGEASTEISLSEYPKGVYLISVQTENGIITKRLVKE
jgi:PKD repeat protein